MKKVLLFIGLVISVNMMFAQTATLKIGTVLDPVAGTVLVPVTLEALDNPQTMDNLISSWGWYIAYDASVLDAGSIPGAATLMNYHPNFSSANYLTNLIEDNPSPGWNTIAIIYSAAWSGEALPGDKFFDIQFTYAEGATIDPNLFWTETKAKGDPDTKFVTNMADDWGNEFMLTLEDGYVGPGGPVVKMWNGNMSENWDDPDNWTPAGVPTMTDDVEIHPEKAFPPVVLTGTATTGMLTIFAGANLTVMGGLTTNGMFTNDGEFFVDDGSYIDMGGMMGIGMFQYNRAGASTKTSLDGWHYLSSPITGFTSDEILDYYLNTWDQATGMWMQHGGTTPCMPMATMGLDTDVDLEAWSINFDEGFALECPALIGTGDVIEFMSPAVPFNTGAYGAGLGFGAGMYMEWNMLGNPYPSFVDPAAIVFDPNVVSSIAFWDADMMNYEYWAATVPAATIPPANGFFVETIGVPAPFGFTGGERTHVATPFWKDDISQLLTLQASNGAQTDKLHIRFMDNMSASFDTKGDAHKLISTATGVPQIYTTVGDEMLAINALPETAMVPMGFTSATTGTYTIEAIETTDFANVVLEDRTTGEQTNLLTSSYTFDYTVGDNANRFFVHFTPLGSSDLEANSVNIWSNEQNIVVDSPADMTGTIVVYNMMGQEVVSAEMEPLRTVIPMNDVNTYYVVKVLTSDNAVTGKVYIK